MSSPARCGTTAFVRPGCSRGRLAILFAHHGGRFYRARIFPGRFRPRLEIAGEMMHDEPEAVWRDWHPISGESLRSATASAPSRTRPPKVPRREGFPVDLDSVASLTAPRFRRSPVGGFLDEPNPPLGRQRLQRSQLARNAARGRSAVFCATLFISSRIISSLAARTSERPGRRASACAYGRRSSTPLLSE